MVFIGLNEFLKFGILGIFGLNLKTGTSQKKNVPQLIQVYVLRNTGVHFTVLRHMCCDIRILHTYLKYLKIDKNILQRDRHLICLKIDKNIL